MKRIGTGPILAVLGAGALFFLLGKKSQPANVTVAASAGSRRTPNPNIHPNTVANGAAAGYPADEGGGNVSQEPVQLRKLTAVGAAKVGAS